MASRLIGRFKQLPHILCTIYRTRVNVDRAHPIVTLKLRTMIAMANASVLP